MDCNYLYIIGVVGCLSFVLCVFIFFKKNNVENVSVKIKEEEEEVKCDEDKCFIKHRQTKCNDKID